MRYSTVGANRRFPDAIVRAVQAWKPPRVMRKELKLTKAQWDYLRIVQHKKRSP